LFLLFAGALAPQASLVTEILSMSELDKIANQIKTARKRLEKSLKAVNFLQEQMKKCEAHVRADATALESLRYRLVQMVDPVGKGDFCG
jgi:predicted  nucleic acid-binding Zn-ribbon protein